MRSADQNNSLIDTTKNNQALAVTFKGNDYTNIVKSLTPEQKKYYLDLAKPITMDDMNSIQKYGSELNSIISRNGETLLAQVRGSKNNEIVELSNNLLAQIQDITIQDFSEKRDWKGIVKCIPIVRHIVKNVEKSVIKFDTVSNNVSKIADKMILVKKVALDNNVTLQRIFDNSVEYIKEIRDYIIAAKVKLEDVQLQLQQMNEHYADYEPYQIQETQSFASMLQKRISDMQTTEYALAQNLLQIRATQTNNLEIAAKSDNLVTNVIPIWKSQLALSVIMNDQKNSVEGQVKTQETTQQIIKKGAELLKQNTIEVAKQSEKSAIEVSTLHDSTQKLIETMIEVKKIHIEGEENRKKIEEELQSFALGLQEALNSSGW